MNTKILIGVIVGLLILGGGAFFLLNSDDNDSSNTETSQNTSGDSESADTKSDTENPVFEPVATTNQSFVVALETESDGTPFVGMISYDGQGSSLFEGKFKEDQLQFYDIDGKFVSCQNGNCFALPDGQNGVDRSTYEYNEDTISDYRNDAVYAGKADCPAGTCDKWTVVKDNVDISMYIADDGRISKAEGSSGGSEFSAVFTYEQVNITAPENVQEFPL